MIEPTSTYDAVENLLRDLKAAVHQKEDMPERKDLIALIESGAHLIIGAKALAHYTPPRFTEDTDYVVCAQTFTRIRKWARDKAVETQDLGMVLRFPSLAVDVIDVRSNGVFKDLLERENKIPSPEGLAAAKYISMVNPHRGDRRFADVGDFAQLVKLPRFDLDKLRSFLVNTYPEQWPDVVKLIDDIKQGRPITI